MSAPNRRRKRRLIAGGLVGAAVVSAVAPVRRAAVERLLRVRATVTDPVAPFLDAPCHTEQRDGPFGHGVSVETGRSA